MNFSPTQTGGDSLNLGSFDQIINSAFLEGDNHIRIMIHGSFDHNGGIMTTSFLEDVIRVHSPGQTLDDEGFPRMLSLQSLHHAVQLMVQLGEQRV